jgi:NADH:ubiquinone oxidoreductase subunit D
MPEKIETTHVLLENELVVYQRERSSIWQCRYKVGGIWQRASTKERDLKKTKPYLLMDHFNWPSTQ